jgi:aminomethyltransferase
VLAQLDGSAPAQRLRVGLVGLERVPVREHVELHNDAAKKWAKSPAACWPPADQPVALAYVQAEYAAVGTR